jgi:hypothetical protein
LFLRNKDSGPLSNLLMKSCRFSPWLAACILPLLLSWSHATTIIAPSFDRLVNSADYVVRATVKSVSSDWRDNPDQPGTRYIGTRVELEVHEVISGQPPSPLVLDLVGGRIGDEELTINGAPKFAAGQESILFIRGNGRQIVPLVGMKYGHYPERRDPRTGADQVMRSGGRLLYHENEIALPDNVERGLVRPPHARPLTASEFAARIRATFRQPETNREQLR